MTKKRIKPPDSLAAAEIKKAKAALRIDLPSITKRIMLINGFGQRPNGQTGISRNWMHLRTKYSSNDTCCSMHAWNDDWKLVVDHILATGPRDVSLLTVIIIAYSWGVGHGAVELARRLQGEGIAVKRIVSCDGVYHSWWWPWRAVWSIVSRNPTINIPANVDQVDMIRQEVNKPSGARIVADVPEDTIIIDHGYLAGRSHQDIDNSPEFLALALEAAK